MGYYATFDYEYSQDLVYDEKKLKHIEKYFSDTENDKIAGFYGVKFVNNQIELIEYCAKFYDDEIFAKKLSKAIKQGWVKLRFVGEDGAVWGYKVLKDKVISLEGYLLTINEHIVMDKYQKGNGVLICWDQISNKSLFIKRLKELCRIHLNNFKFLIEEDKKC